jgi:diguanylate cyclase (GGDEF)-like protein
MFGVIPLRHFISARREKASLGSASRFVPVAVAISIGCGLTITAATLAARWEERVARQDFTAVSESHLLVLQNGWNEYLNKLVALRAFFESFDAVTRPEFEIFTQRLLRGESAVQNFSWVPRVSKDERWAYEYLAASDGIADFSIKAVPRHGTLVPSPERDEYLPIFYSTLPKKNRLYGVDLLSTIPDKIKRARDLDQLSCVPNWVLHSAEGVKHGILFSLPVYRRGATNATVEDRRRNLRGFVHGAFLITEMVQQTINANMTPQGIDVFLFDAEAAPTDLPLYTHGSRLRAAPPAPRSQAEIKGGIHWSGDIKVGDVRWTVLTAPLTPGPLVAGYARAWIVAGAGLLMTLLAVIYILATQRHARRLLAANREVAELARRDPLTGLANRRHFLELLATAFADYQRGGPAFAVLYFDLDHFKDINDTLGHPLGDKLLRIVADRVKGLIRRSDVAARFGGDEFAILQKNISTPEASRTLAAKINEALGQPCQLDGNEAQISATIGIVVASAASDPEAIMIQADLALYRAKEIGRGRFHLHSPDLDEQVRERVTLTDDLRLALQRGEIGLHYQPQVEITSGRIVGVEALARWNHPRRGLLMPLTFIPIAERTGLILPLGQQVFERVCRDLRGWLDEGIAPDRVAVNVSAAQFKLGAELEDEMRESMARWRIPRGRLELELTESVLMAITKQPRTVVEGLHHLGLTLAIDDFGTGYSSLNYLTWHQVDRLKIAKELVCDVSRNSRNAAVVRAAIRLANELGIDFLAEGVEDAVQADFLVAAGCSYAQGYHFGRPMEAEAVALLLRGQATRAAAAASPCLETSLA